MGKKKKQRKSTKHKDLQKTAATDKPTKKPTQPPSNPDQSPSVSRPRQPNRDVVITEAVHRLTLVQNLLEQRNLTKGQIKRAVRADAKQRGVRPPSARTIERTLTRAYAIIQSEAERRLSAEGKARKIRQFERHMDAIDDVTEGVSFVFEQPPEGGKPRPVPYKRPLNVSERMAMARTWERLAREHNRMLGYRMPLSISIGVSPEQQAADVRRLLQESMPQEAEFEYVDEQQAAAISRLALTGGEGSEDAARGNGSGSDQASTGDVVPDQPED